MIFMDLKVIMIFLIYTVLIISDKQTTHGEPQVPCYFIFGDSLVDSGNNNHLKTTAKANYLPYGIDFPGGPTGRFSNGRTIVDFIATYLGFEKYIPPFATAKGREIIEGVNYGSGGCGIRDETGSHMGDCISLKSQLQHHQKTISSLASLLGNKTSANLYLRKCLYTVNSGSNDYINNYLLPKFYNTSKLYKPQEYADALIIQYSQQLKALYLYGARKIVLHGLGPCGCIPEELEIYGSKQQICVEWINDAIQLFNQNLKNLVSQLNTNSTDAKYIFIDTFTIQSLNSSYTGLNDINRPCCKVISGNVSQVGQCIPHKKPCRFRQFCLFFFDNFHPTDIVNMFTSFRAYFAPLPLDAYPMSILQLVQLSL